MTNSFKETFDPSVTNDETEGFALGDEWLNTISHALFRLKDPTTGAADWQDILQVATSSSALHGLAGGSHAASSLSQLNTLISDADLDASTATRPPKVHGLGGADHTGVIGDIGGYTKAEVDVLVDATMKAPEAFAPAGTYPVTYAGNAVESGDSFRVTVAGTLGAVTVNAEDLLIALIDTPAQVDANWMVAESNRDQSTETTKGVAELATQAETNAGTDDGRFITPLKLASLLTAFLRRTGGTISGRILIISAADLQFQGGAGNNFLRGNVDNTGRFSLFMNNGEALVAELNRNIGIGGRPGAFKFNVFGNARIQDSLEIAGTLVDVAHPALTTNPHSVTAAQVGAYTIAEVNALPVAAHAVAHADGGSDELSVEALATAATDTALVLKPNGLGGIAFGAAPGGGGDRGCVQSKDGARLIGVSVGSVLSDDGTLAMTLASVGQVDLGTTGKDGLDTGTVAASTHYSVWVIGDSAEVNAEATLAVVDGDVPALPTGYDRKRLRGHVLTDASANIHDFIAMGGNGVRTVMYTYGLSDAEVFAAQDVNTFMTAVVSQVPVTAKYAELQVMADAGDGDYFEVRATGSGLANGNGRRFRTPGTSDGGKAEQVAVWKQPLNASQQFDWRKNDATGNADMHCWGYGEDI